MGLFLPAGKAPILLALSAEARAERRVVFKAFSCMR